MLRRDCPACDRTNREAAGHLSRPGPRQVVRGRAGPRRRRPRGRAGHRARRPRPERRRQDDRRARAHDAADARRGHARAWPASTSSRDARELRSRIGLAGQYAAVDENLTGRREPDRWSGGSTASGAARRARRALELLERFSLVDAGDRVAKTYSGGMRRRLDLAAALVARPPVLFLDEPTTGPRPALAHRPVGDDRGARRRRHDRAADDAVPRRGRPARRPDRGRSTTAA